MRPQTRVVLAAAVAGVFAVALAVHAQESKAPASGGGGLSASGGPIDITADEQEVFQQEHRILWKGNVDAVQDKARLKTPRLEVFYTARSAAGSQPAPAAGSGETGKIERMEAEGPVYYTNGAESATGDHGTYLAANDTITLSGHVVVMQDKNVAKGDKLVIEQKTGHSTLSTNAQSGGKVRGVFYPNQKPAERH